MPNVFAALQSVGLAMEPIFCGGEKRINQEREQWASGCNFVALRPGLVASYARNEATLREMERIGIRIVASVDFLTGQERYVRVEVEDVQGRRAWTNPLFMRDAAPRT